VLIPLKPAPSLNAFVLLLFCILGVILFGHELIKMLKEDYKARKERKIKQKIWQECHNFKKNYNYSASGVTITKFATDLTVYLKQKGFEQKYINDAVESIITSAVFPENLLN